jgi:hypothetical protein
MIDRTNGTVATFLMDLILWKVKCVGQKRNDNDCTDLVLFHCIGSTGGTRITGITF